MVTIIIVIYKSDKKKLLKVLNKFQNKYKVILIDNSLNYNFSGIKITKKIKIIRSNNVGNGAGINIALKKCKTKFAIYLDIDVDFKINALKNLVRYTKKIKDFSVLVPNHGNLISKHKLLKKFSGEASMMLFDINKIKKVGFFDEKFFLYFEESDLFLRIKRLNQNVYFTPKIKIIHNRASSITSFETENLRSWHYMWSMFYFYKKNFNYFIALKKTYLLILIDIVMLMFFLFSMNIKEVKKRFFRIYGVMCSLIGISSFLRP